jgi:AraC-like DNA-binding protein
MVAAYNGLRFSTDSLPERDRLPFWRDAFARSMLKIEVAPVDGRPFRERAAFYESDNLNIVRSDTNGNSGWRTKTLLADSNDDFMFISNLVGFSVPSMRGREFTLRAGAATLLTAGEIVRQDFPEHTQFICFRIPRRTLGALVADPEHALMREIPADNEALRLLVDYATLTLDKHELATPQLRRLFAAHIHDLVVLAIGGTRDAAEIAKGRGQRAARLSALKADIAANLADENLSVGSAARRHKVTPRYVQLLFEEDGTTFSEYVLAQRLTRAHHMLSEARFAALTISAIAFEAGFTNLSYFDRTFRARFGATPSDVRAAARSAPTH